MNVAQICRQALFESGLVLSGGETSPFITQDELLRWANEGRDELEKQLRSAEQDYLWRTLNSGDAAFEYENETYDPSSFAFTGDTTINRFLLPPDLLILKELRISTVSQIDVRFEQRDHSTNDFQAIIRSTSPTRDLILFDIVDERTLYLANPPDTVMAVQISYIQRSPRLRFYNTGTVTTVQDDATVEGAGTPNWLIENLDNAGKMEIGFAASGATAVSITGTTTPFVDIQEIAYPVASFTDDDTLEMDTVWRRTALAGVGYYLASLPEVPREHHHMIVTYVKMKIQEKMKNYTDLNASREILDRKYAKMITDIQERQNVNPEFVEDYEDQWV